MSTENLGPFQYRLMVAVIEALAILQARNAELNWQPLLIVALFLSYGVWKITSKKPKEYTPLMAVYVMTSVCYVLALSVLLLTLSIISIVFRG